LRKVLYLMGILSDADVQWLASYGVKSVVPAGAFLVRRGVAIDHLYILLDGRLSIELANGVEAATLMTGEVVGEISFVDSRPPLASVRAQLPSVVLGIDKTHLKLKLESDGGFGSRFYKAIALFLADRLRSTTGRLGYGGPADEEETEDDLDELDSDFMQLISMANVRFEFLMRSME